MTECDCDCRNGLGGWEKFQQKCLSGCKGSGKASESKVVVLRGGKGKKYCADEGNKGVKCNRCAFAWSCSCFTVCNVV